MGSSCSRDILATDKQDAKHSWDAGNDTVDTPNNNNTSLLAVKFVNGEKIVVFKYVGERDEWPICHEVPVDGIFRTFIVQQYMLFIDWTNAKRICCYDITTRAIRTLEPIKNEVYMHYFAAEFEGNLYLFADIMDKRKVNVWDPVMDSWSQAPKLNVAREHAAAVSHRGYLYVAGGRKDYLFNSELRSVERYDPRRRRWQRCADLLQARCAAGLVSAGTFLYIVGGECSEIPTNMVECYDAQINKWTQLLCMQVPKHYPACAFYNNSLLACGGPTLDQDCRIVEEFNAAQNKWLRKNSMPSQGPYSYVIVTPTWLRQLESTN
ncbi:PREDICTED: kelch-like protein diablo [Bactrocera latifrons]|uniref:kelch-like protein diablo n=1 Tax=Bactrocera latifrons TaxID=174628 RepID=UPI0008DD3074|nr:PREDICTED: kelch-like protein diablo [Bactrocera latifrons]XP_018798056.1 PREDICTED: kelch-like protein diablo [Bactrocera latifrons]XP_018798057.1 PREDICTED: kelch-like protein diablo [Bactrocera latifrons]XP_018798058.1 PREDICTED: kelch-like protein diablo [Bactrocera latifrons]